MSMGGKGHLCKVALCKESGGLGRSLHPVGHSLLMAAASTCPQREDIRTTELRSQFCHLLIVCLEYTVCCRRSRCITAMG